MIHGNCPINALKRFNGPWSSLRESSPIPWCSSGQTGFPHESVVRSMDAVRLLGFFQMTFAADNTG